MPSIEAHSKLSPAQWLEQGGEIPHELLEDPRWSSEVAELLRTNPALALLVVTRPREYQSGLSGLGLTIDPLVSAIKSTGDRTVKSVARQYGEHSFPAAFARLVRRTLDLPPARAEETYPFLRGHLDHWKKMLVEGGPEPFQLDMQRIGAALGAVLIHGTYAKTTTNVRDQENQYALVGAAAQALVAPRPVSTAARLNLAACALRPAGGGYAATEFFQRLRTTEGAVNAFTSALENAVGDVWPSILADGQIPPGVEAILAQCPDVAGVLEKMRLPIDLKAARIQQILARIPQNIASRMGSGMDPWPQFTLAALGESDGMAVEAQSILRRVGLTGGGVEDWSSPEFVEALESRMADPRLWQRRRHAEFWVDPGIKAGRERVLAQARREIATLPSPDAVYAPDSPDNPVGMVRRALVSTRLASGKDKANALAAALGLGERDVEAAYNAFLDANWDFLRGDAMPLSPAIVRRLLTMGEAALTEQFADDKSEPKTAPLLYELAVAQFKGRFKAPDQWLCDVLIGGMEVTDNPPAASSAWGLLSAENLPQRLMEGDTTAFKRLPAEKRIRIAEQAMTAGVAGARDALGAYLTEEVERIRNSVVLPAEERDRVHEDLESARAVILGDTPSADVDPALVEALRAGNASAFRPAPRQPVVRPAYKEQYTRKQRIRRELLSIRGVLAVAVVLPALWLVWTYLIPSFSSRPAPVESIEKPPVFSPATLGLQKPRMGQTVWMAPDPVTLRLFHSLARRSGDEAANAIGSPGHDDAPATVTYAEAVWWCQTYGDYLRTAYPDAFGPSGSLNSLVLRLPTLDELQQWRSMKGMTSGGEKPEWVWVGPPPEQWNARVTTGPDGKELPADAPGVTFRMVLGPKRDKRLLPAVPTPAASVAPAAAAAPVAPAPGEAAPAPPAPAVPQ